MKKQWFNFDSLNIYLPYPNVEYQIGSDITRRINKVHLKDRELTENWELRDQVYNFFFRFTNFFAKFFSFLVVWWWYIVSNNKIY